MPTTLASVVTLLVEVVRSARLTRIAPRPLHRKATAFAFACLVCITSAQAQVPGSPETSFTLYTENDDWPPDTGTDKNYTNGFRLTIDRNWDVLRLHEFGLFRWVPGHPSCSDAREDEVCISTAFHVGQQFYTPDDIEIERLQPRERPYAGWLYGGGTWRAANNEKAVITDVYVGATGPASLAEPVQKKWHKLVGAAEPKGWDHQIRGRLGFIVGHSRHWAYDVVTNHHRWLEFSPFVGSNLGNIITDTYAGARIKLGYNITRDWTQGAISPVLMRHAPWPGSFELFLSIQGRGRVVGYNAFLDAADHHQLERRPTVADAGIGVGVRFGSFRVSYRLALITHEYEEAPTSHEYKALRFTYMFR